MKRNARLRPCSWRKSLRQRRCAGADRRSGDREDRAHAISARTGNPTENQQSTFTIVKEYTDGRLPLYHFDVYRVTDPDALFEIGADSIFTVTASA